MTSIFIQNFSICIGTGRDMAEIVLSLRTHIPPFLEANSKYGSLFGYRRSLNFSGFQKRHVCIQTDQDIIPNIDLSSNSSFHSVGGLILEITILLNRGG